MGQLQTEKGGRGREMRIRYSEIRKQIWVERSLNEGIWGRGRVVEGMDCPGSNDDEKGVGVGVSED